jgi:prevent-host-death family protein
MMVVEVLRMSVRVNVHEAKTHLSRLLAQVRNGQEIIISEAGKPVARLVPIEERLAKRVAGSARSNVIIAEDFDAPIPEFILNSFEQ